MNNPGQYKVDFTELASYPQLANSLSYSLDQFKNKRIYEAVLSAFIAEVNEAYLAVIEAMRRRCFIDASGQWLDTIGVIVGQPKESIPVGAEPFFHTWDTDDLDFDVGLQWISGQPDVSGYTTPTDADYQDQILKRIIANTMRYGSVPELEDAFFRVTGIVVKIEELGEAKIKLYVPVGTTTSQKVMLTTRFFTTTDGTYNKWSFPYPETTEIDATIGEY